MDVKLEWVGVLYASFQTRNKKSKKEAISKKKD